jgi:hypothetical protein
MAVCPPSPASGRLVISDAPAGGCVTWLGGGTFAPAGGRVGKSRLGPAPEAETGLSSAAGTVATAPQAGHRILLPASSFLAEILLRHEVQLKAIMILLRLRR